MLPELLLPQREQERSRSPYLRSCCNQQERRTGNHKCSLERCKSCKRCKCLAQHRSILHGDSHGEVGDDSGSCSSSHNHTTLFHSRKRELRIRKLARSKGLRNRKPVRSRVLHSHKLVRSKGLRNHKLVRSKELRNRKLVRRVRHSRRCRSSCCDRHSPLLRASDPKGQTQSSACRCCTQERGPLS